jgi:NAD(P)H-hydrate epimerase
MRFVTAEAMRALDRHTIGVLGVPGETLMARAGRAVALGARDLDRQLHPPRGTRRFLALAGVGNNGGDAYAAARVLLSWGWQGEILECADPDRIRGDAALHRRRALAAGVPAAHCTGPDDLRDALRLPSVVIDGLLGTGIRGEVREPFRSLIGVVNESHRPVLAVDIPSGLHADTGTPLPECVRADVTVTMALPKLGLVVDQGLDASGRIIVADIGIPRDVKECPPGMPEWIDEDEAAAWIAPRRPTDHKGRFGHVLIVAGSVGFAGAAVLCARGALRAGAGLVSLFVPDAVYWPVAAQLREAMVHPGPTTGGKLDALAVPLLLELAERATALAIGPGLGASPDVSEVVTRLLQETSAPAVVDADGLNVLGSPPGALPRGRGACVLTPHPGEMRRLLSAYDWAAGLDPALRPAGWDIARRLARETDAVTVLKGAGTLVADPADASLSVNGSGNPGMATGGSGDVLTGMIGARLAGGDEPAQAARLAVYLHGAAGDLAAERQGATATTPTDLLAMLPVAIRRLESRCRIR